MSEADRKVQCDIHGESAACFVCQHVACGVACGFHPDEGDKDDPWPDAWCDLCQQNLEREGEWNDASEKAAGVRLQCAGCYEDARRRNLRLPRPLRAGQTSTTDEEFQELVATACQATKLAQERAKAAHEGLGSSGRWGADYEAGLFTFGDGPLPSLVAEMQVVGTFSKQSNSWLWSWANESMEPGLIREVRWLQTLGQVRGISRLSEPYLPGAEEVDGWEMTSLACYLLGWEAVYRAPMDHRYLFVLLRNFRRTN